MIDVPNMTDNYKEVADCVMDRACTDCQLMKNIGGMWNERFHGGMIVQNLYVCLTLLIGCMCM